MCTAGLARSTHSFRPTPVPESTLRLMARIKAFYLEDPCSGSRRMVEHMAREGILISPDRERNVMPRLGLRVIYQKPRTMVQATRRRDSSVWWTSVWSRLWIRFGLPTSSASHCRKDFFIW